MEYKEKLIEIKGENYKKQLRSYLLGFINKFQFNQFISGFSEFEKSLHNKLLLSILHSSSINKYTIKQINKPFLTLETNSIRSLSETERNRLKSINIDPSDDAEGSPNALDPLPFDINLCSETRQLPTYDSLHKRLKLAVVDNDLTNYDNRCLEFMSTSLNIYLKNILQNTLDKSNKISLDKLRLARNNCLDKHLVINANKNIEQEEEEDEIVIDNQLFSDTLGSPPPAPPQHHPPPKNALKRPLHDSLNYPNKRSRKPKAVIVSSDEDDDVDPEFSVQ